MNNKERVPSFTNSFQPFFHDHRLVGAFYARIMDCRVETDQQSGEFKLNVLLQTLKSLEGVPLNQWDDHYPEESQVVEMLTELQSMIGALRRSGPPAFLHTLLNIEVRVNNFISGYNRQHLKV